MSNKKDDIFSFNIITLGDSGVGKTSIIQRYVNNSFLQDTIATIGFNYGFKDVTLKNNKIVKLKLVDTAGQERYRAINKSYYKNVNAVLFAFSLDKEGSLEKIKEWKKIFEENKVGENIPTYLIRNKCDLDEDDFDEELVEDLLKENNFLRFISVSAKNDININSLFEEIAENWYNKVEKGQKNMKNQRILTLEKNEEKIKNVKFAQLT